MVQYFKKRDDLSMKKDDLKKAIEELKIELEKGFTKCDEGKERTRILKNNMFERKLILTFGYSMLLYVVLPILVILSKFLGISVPIPAEIFSIIIASTALGIGTIGRKIHERKNKRKEKFTIVTSYQENLEEEIKYEIEVEKNINKNKAVEQALSLLELEQLNLDELSDKYDISAKNMPQTKEEAQNKIAKILEILKKQYTELDLLTTKMFLSKKIDKTEKETLKYKLVTTITTNLYYLTSLLVALCLTTLSSMILSFMPFVALSICSIEYVKRRKKEYERIFNKLNKDLEVNVSEDENLENKIKEIRMTIIQVQEQKRVLESFMSDADEKEPELESSLVNEITYSPKIYQHL